MKTNEPWRNVWRKGVAPQLSTESLEALRQALLSDDKRLIQSATTQPPPLSCVQEWGCEGACLLGFGPWQSEGLQTVVEVEERFARICFEADQTLGEPATIRHLLNWFDDAPREQMRRELLTEVEREIGKRESPMPTMQT